MSHRVWSKERLAESVSAARSGARLLAVKGGSWLPDGMLQDAIQLIVAKIDEKPTVDATVPANGDVLTYDSASGKYKPSTSGSAPVTSVFTRTGAVASASGDYNAGQITNTPAGNIAATTVQAALNELDTEKPPTTRAINTTAPLSGGGDLSANRTLAVSAATGSASGVAQIASQAQADAGTDDATIMTPLKVATRPQKNSVFETHIQGLQLTWNTPGNNGNLLTVSSGSAWIPSLGRVYNVPSVITGPTQTLTASTWHYVYLYDNSGTPAIEISTTAPAAPYKGNARAKTSDTSRRFIGQVLADATGTPVMRQFAHIGNEDMIYPASSLVAPFRIINGVGPGASQVTQSLASICPPGVTTQICATMTVGISTTGGNTYLELFMIGGSRVGIAGGMISTANGFLFTAGWFPVNSTTPDIHYSTTGPASSTFYLDIVGYKFVR